MKPLPAGGTIGVGAFASSYDMRSEVERGVEWWESRGYRVKLTPGVYERDDYVAGDARSRADDLHALFADSEVDVVQTLQGGFGSSELIPHLDFDLIAANPKPFVGYSDITSLHVPIRQRAGFPPSYGSGLMKRSDAGRHDWTAGAAPGEMHQSAYCDPPRDASDWRASKSVEDVLEQRLQPLGVPVLYTLPLGHGKHLASIPLGVRYTLDADARTLTVDESPFGG